ncbi:ABC transporter ATP-binding protein [Natronococcus pandeyae]|uniref:ABC transporter ATP-binding protein n=1 Tax=Natronococcus pandeyae TaxID=2055836 RepID=UPI0027B992A1|nr:ABC transporter ATP-binding protein [Natronococcus pandeyae]
MLEGIGLTFLLPIIEIAQHEDPTAEAEGIMLAFVLIYETFGIPFTLGSVILGVTLVMGLRFGTLFFLKWFKEVLRSAYIRDLRRRGFENALNARTAYYDQKGSDEVLNAIITQTQYAGKVIEKVIFFLEKAFLAIVFAAIAFYLSPFLSIFAAVTFVVLTFIVQNAVEKGTSVGNRVADANERIQEVVQMGTQGIRDVKMFGMVEEIYGDFSTAIDQFVESRVSVKRNKAAINSSYQFISAAMLFVLIYLALTIGAMSLAALGVFLFAMFRLAPIVSNLNEEGYDILADMPHLIRTQRFVDGLQEYTEPSAGDKQVPDRIDTIQFENVTFAYNDENVLKNVSFELTSGDFVAFVGQSGAGKSTIALLLASLYVPDSGRITVNGAPLSDFPVTEWREKIAIVRQDPFIFNDTLRYNLTIGNREATQREIERACEIAMVTEFLDGLPNGYDSMLGDDGVQLSGGQKQRVAIARALLKDAEILILDEATSDLDTNLEDRIKRSLEETAREFTTLAIAHRLSTVRNADRIYTLEGGRITETGEHGELLDEGGKYSELYRSQVTTD